MANFDPEKEKVFYNMTHYDYLFNFEAWQIQSNKQENDVRKKTPGNRKKV